MNMNIDKTFSILENNALYKGQLIKKDAGSILEKCSTKKDVIYLLKMIYDFLNFENFLSLEPTLLYKMQLLMNLIKVNKEYYDLFDEIGCIEFKIKSVLEQTPTLSPQISYMSTHFAKYQYPNNSEMTGYEILTNLSEHYDIIQTIKRLDEPTAYFGKMSFLEVFNLSVSQYHVQEASYDLRDYYIDVVDFFAKDFKHVQTSKIYKKYLRQTRRFIKREVR